MPARRLLVESFVLLDPRLAARTRSLPFWTTFPVESSARALERYLDEAEPYDEIRIAPVRARRAQHRTGSARALAAGARTGARARRLPRHPPDAFPEDFAVFARFPKEFRALPERHPVPDPLPLEEAERLIARVNAAQAAS